MGKKEIIIIAILFLLIGCPGCVTMAKNVYRDNFKPIPIPTTIPPTPAPIVTPILTPIMTPIQIPPVDPHIVFKRQGGYNMSEWFEFSRKTYRDLIKVKVTVYRYQIRDIYSLVVLDQDIPIFRMPKPGYKFLFIWVKAVSNSTTPLGGYNSHSFKINYRNMTIEPQFEPDRIKELVGYYDFNHDYLSSPYGYLWGMNYETKKREYLEREDFTVGDSNAWDGYILYEIPGTATIDDLMVSASFDSMFNARWQFVNGDKFSLAYPPPLQRSL
jgi:hypothetical protein